MEPWAAELLSVWDKNNDDVAKELLDAMERDPTQQGKYSLEDMRQFMRGGLAIFEAELGGRGAELREAYLQSIMPGVLHHQGTPLGVAAAVTLVVAVRSYPLLLERMSPENRAKAGDFFCSAYQKYMTDFIRVGLEVLNDKSS
jgi:hypothetical protein